VATCHGLCPTIATNLPSFSSPENTPVAIIIMMWVRQHLVTVSVADVDPLHSIACPHLAPAVVVVAAVIVEVGRAKERKAMEAPVEEEGAMEEATVDEAGAEAGLEGGVRETWRERCV
jgi:hypothetical protein